MQTSELVFSTTINNENNKEVILELFFVKDNNDCFFVTDNEERIRAALMEDYLFRPQFKAHAATLLLAINKYGFKTFDDV